MTKQPPTTPAIRKTQSRVPHSGSKTHTPEADTLKVFMKELEGKMEIQYPPIGETHSSKVYKALYNGNLVALKCLQPNTRQPPDAKTREFRLGNKLKHPHLVWYQEIFCKQSYLIAFSLDYCNGPDLCQYIKDSRKNNKNDLTGNRDEDDRFWDFCLDILLGLEFLHVNNLVHFDICPSNIFMVHDETRKSKFTLKIGDFGSMVEAGHQSGSCNSGRGDYQAPEISTNFEHQEVSTSVDIYGLGVTCIEMITGVASISMISKLPTLVQSMVEKMIENEKEGRWSARQILDYADYQFERPLDKTEATKDCEEEEENPAVSNTKRKLEVEEGSTDEEQRFGKKQKLDFGVETAKRDLFAEFGDHIKPNKH
eukprot:TRINITY_DN17084_c0_g1_i1.p1 TRINITY_DN17084_c0_g1~~TRINITY_DN17084_c0_g1_i1.p1  ORF type:complete len:396 (+),score=56.43 TRINITY_DN17084_c0_g1_i1:87-1190(+)